MNDYNFSALATAITLDRQERLLAAAEIQQRLRQLEHQHPVTHLRAQLLNHSGSALIRLRQWLKTPEDEKPVAYA